MSGIGTQQRHYDLDDEAHNEGAHSRNSQNEPIERKDRGPDQILRTPVARGYHDRVAMLLDHFFLFRIG